MKSCFLVSAALVLALTTAQAQASCSTSIVAAGITLPVGNSMHVTLSNATPPISSPCLAVPAGSGVLTVSTSTNGLGLPAADYTVTIDGTNSGFTLTALIPATGDLTAKLVQGGTSLSQTFQVTIPPAVTAIDLTVP